MHLVIIRVIVKYVMFGFHPEADSDSARLLRF